MAILAVCFSAIAAPVSAQLPLQRVTQLATDFQNANWLRAGIALSREQSKRLDSMPGLMYDGGEVLVGKPAWKDYLQNFRAVLTPAQQLVFDVNVQAESTWALYRRAGNQLWDRRGTLTMPRAPNPRAILLQGFVEAYFFYYWQFADSLSYVPQPQSPAQMQHRWETSLKAFWALLTPAEQQRLNLQVDKYTQEAELLAMVQARDPKRLFAGVGPSGAQQTQLSALFAQGAGTSDSTTWQATLQQMRAVLTPTQQRVFDVNMTVDSGWKTYAMAFQQQWLTRTSPGDDSVREIFIPRWNHYRAVGESLQTVAQTPAQMQQRWDMDRQSMRSAVQTVLSQNSEQVEFKQQIYQFSSEAALFATVRTHDPKRLFPGIVLSADQQTKLSPLMSQGASALDLVWNATLLQMRAVLTPAQQPVFNTNLTVDSAWKTYAETFGLWALNTEPPEDDLIGKAFFTKWNHHLAVNDSLQNVSQTPAEMQQRWETDRLALRVAIQPFLTADQQQQFRQMIHRQFDQFSADGALFATTQAHDPKRLFPGIVLSGDQQTQLSPLLAQAVAGTSNSVWNATLPQMRAVLTSAQQSVFDVNLTVDSAWKTYAAIFDQWGQRKKPPEDDSIMKAFFTKWNHHQAVNDSLQNVSQTPAQIQQLWETDRLALRATIQPFLTADEQQQADQEFAH